MSGSVAGESSRSRATNLVGQLDKELKIPLPPEFTGKRSEAGSFLIQVELYIGFNNTRFKSETEKILWTTALFRESAAEWAQGYLSDYLGHVGPGGALTDAMDSETVKFLGSWQGFKKKFNMVFGDPNKARTAELNLRRVRQKGSATHYTTEFQKWSNSTNWSDDSLRAQYYEGLKDDVKDDIARDEWPSSLDKMMAAAIKIDTRLHERRLERAGKGTNHRFVARKPKAHRNQWDPMELDYAGRGQYPKKGNKGNNKPKGLSPDEKKRRREKGLCFECGLPGHQAASHRKQLNAARGKQLNMATKGSLLDRWLGIPHDEEPSPRRRRHRRERRHRTIEVDAPPPHYSTEPSDLGPGTTAMESPVPEVEDIQEIPHEEEVIPQMVTGRDRRKGRRQRAPSPSSSSSSMTVDSWFDKPPKVDRSTKPVLDASSSQLPGPQVGQVWEVTQREQFATDVGTREWRLEGGRDVLREDGYMPEGAPNWGDKYEVAYRDEYRAGWREIKGKHLYMMDLPRAFELPPLIMPQYGECWILKEDWMHGRLWEKTDAPGTYYVEVQNCWANQYVTGWVYRLVQVNNETHWRNVLTEAYKLGTQEIRASTGIGQIVLDVEINGDRIRALIDSGATANFVSPRVVSEHGWETRVMDQAYPLLLVNGEETPEGRVQVETCPLSMNAERHSEKIVLDITEIGKHEVILGMPWLRQHNPTVDWGKGLIKFDKCQCQDLVRTREVCATSNEQSGHPAQGPPLEEVPKEYEEFKDVFADPTDEHALPKHQPWDHEIPLKEGMTPPFLPPYRVSPEDGRILEEFIQKNLAKGFIRPSSSQARAPTLFAPKPGGGKRLCIDFRKLNAMTVRDSYPLPHPDHLRDQLRGAQWFTQLDLRESYHLVRMKEGEEWKTAFGTPNGHYECLVMWEGLTNAPATMQRLIHNTLRPHLDTFCVSYLDDILVYARTKDQVRQYTKLVFEKLRAAGLRLKLSKCRFDCQKVTFLGFEVTPNGLAMDQSKVQTVLDWGIPQTVKDVQSFLGFANYNRRFIKGYSQIAAPLMDLTKKDNAFEWTERTQEAFDVLKRAFTTAPVLTAYDPDKQVHVETDASDYAIGAVLSQPDEKGKYQPVAYFSRRMTAPELNYDIHDKELLAIVEACREWRVYLEGARHQVQVLTDHKNLVHFTTTKDLNKRQVRWSEMLANYDIRISYVKGTENVRADALSRKPEYIGNKTTTESRAIFKIDGEDLVLHQQLAATTLVVTDKAWAERIKEAYDTDAVAKQQLESPQREYGKTAEGLLTFLGRVYVPTTLRRELITEIHSLPGHGHQGVRKTKERIRRNYYFPGLSKIVNDVVTSCHVCIQNKSARHAPYGKLVTQETPARPWKSIALDFITKLPRSKDEWTGKEYDAILNVTDRLTKYAYFVPYLESSTAEDLGGVLFKTIVTQHGVPDEIVSDRDKLFTSKYWTTLMALIGVKRKMSTSFHPQTDGQTERINQTLKAYLRCYINYQQNNWVDLLPMAQYAYNSAESEGTGYTPFYANLGYTPTVYEAPLVDKAKSNQAILRVEELKELHQELAEDIKFIAARTAMYYDRKHSVGPTLKKGDKVYLLRRNVKTKRPSEGLDHKKLGPFEIREQVGPVNYRLKLPRTMKIHDTFHVSLLTKAPPGSPPAPAVDAEPLDAKQDFEVEAILDCQYFRGTKKWLVHWRGYPSSEDS